MRRKFVARGAQSSDRLLALEFDFYKAQHTTPQVVLIPRNVDQYYFDVASARNEESRKQQR